MLGSEVHRELKELVAEASRALARLDAERLVELALSCEALNRDLPSADSERRQQLERQSREAVHEMGIFARVLEATRANLAVMSRLREMCGARPEYTCESRQPLAIVEGRDGDN
jgi:hypothetical protein